MFEYKNPMIDRPAGKIDVLIDTDAYNEIDDQYAIAYALRSRDKLNVVALCAAPFSNKRAATPALGMQMSYDELSHIASLCGEEDIPRYRGSESYLPNDNTPVPSATADAIVSLALAHTKEEPLYIAALGAITNVASALLINPDIRDRVVIVWLGGHSISYPVTNEFNMRQDYAAARVVMSSGARFVLIPVNGGVESLKVTEPELRHWLYGKNELCNYLVENAVREAESYAKGTPWSRTIWDIAPIAWLLDTDSTMLRERAMRAPLPSDEGRYVFCDDTPYIEYVFHANRDLIFTDVFAKLAK